MGEGKRILRNGNGRLREAHLVCWPAVPWHGFCYRVRAGVRIESGMGGEGTGSSGAWGGACVASMLGALATVDAWEKIAVGDAPRGLTSDVARVHLPLMTNSQLFTHAHVLARKWRRHCSSYHCAFTMALRYLQCTLTKPKCTTCPAPQAKLLTVGKVLGMLCARVVSLVKCFTGAMRNTLPLTIPSLLLRVVRWKVRFRENPLRLVDARQSLR